MDLSCNDFRECQKVGDGYVCHLGDDNYLFIKCDILLITLKEQTFIRDPNDILKNIHFVYEQNGERKIIPDFQPKFNTVLQNGSLQYQFSCNITRPDSLPLVENKEHPARIELHFKTDLNIECIQFNVNSSFTGDHPPSFISKLFSWLK